MNYEKRFIKLMRLPNDESYLYGVIGGFCEFYELEDGLRILTYVLAFFMMFVNIFAFVLCYFFLVLVMKSYDPKYDRESEDCIVNEQHEDDDDDDEKLKKILDDLD